MKYKDKEGNVLYGFSQESLDKTNRELRKTNKLLLALIILVIIFLIVTIATISWIELNNVVTKIIYGS